jgi:general secretion pathway protein J
MRRTAARGFTLIELLVALTVMAVMAVMSWQGIDAMSRAQAQSRERSQQVMTLQTGLSQWMTDLDAQIQVPQTPSLDWNGRALRLVRNSSISGEGLRVVAWASRLENGQSHWLRWQSPALRTRGDLQEAWLQAALWTQNPGDEQKKREVMIVPLAQWQVFYYRQNAWTSPLSSDDSTGSAKPASAVNASATLPDGIRLILTLPATGAPSGVITRDWIRPTLSVSKS